MTVYVALLRGVNVGGHNRIRMTALKQALTDLGLDRVETYIQSGNVLFHSIEEAPVLRGRIEQQIRAVFGLDVPVVLRTAAELAQIVANNPFSEAEMRGAESLAIALLADSPPAGSVERLADQSATGSDEFRVAGRDVYILYRQPSHKSKLSNLFFEQKLGVPATTRNWQTVNQLALMAESLRSR